MTMLIASVLLTINCFNLLLKDFQVLMKPSDFSSGDTLGWTRISGDFYGTLISKTNGLTAIITFFCQC